MGQVGNERFNGELATGVTQSFCVRPLSRLSGGNRDPTRITAWTRPGCRWTAAGVGLMVARLFSSLPSKKPSPPNLEGSLSRGCCPHPARRCDSPLSVMCRGRIENPRPCWLVFVCYWVLQFAGMRMLDGGQWTVGVKLCSEAVSMLLSPLARIRASRSGKMLQLGVQTSKPELPVQRRAESPIVCSKDAWFVCSQSHSAVSRTARRIAATFGPRVSRPDQATNGPSDVCCCNRGSAQVEQHRTWGAVSGIHE
ncbi:hypothetical protein B0J18DRAFT_26790 [Chaetomium sp. MPI-SDFR-AT-0129]|nr:hypothetical protein B0J18DRAFT_26790 [Chaetomium sp. MPI-SDFR-AT-0129]